MQPKVRSGILLDIDYTFLKGKLRVRLHMKGKKFYYLYAKHEPYFYVEGEESEIPELVKTEALWQGQKIKPAKIEIVERVLEGRKRPLLKVHTHSPPQVPSMRIGFKNRRAWEFDIPFGRRYLMDMGLEPFMKLKYEREGRKLLKVISSRDSLPKLNMMSFDIETYNPHGAPRNDIDPSIMVSFAHGKGIEPADAKVITWKKIGKDYVDVQKDEKGMLDAFSEYVRKIDPDLLVGYNSTNFDLPYLQARANKCKTQLKLGRDGTSFTLRHAGIRDIAKIKGRIYADLFPIARFMAFIGVFKLARFTLDSVYAELVGKSSWKAKVQKLGIWEMWDDESKLEDLAEYSRMDAIATYAIAQKMLPLQIEMAKVTGLPINDVVSATSSQLVEGRLMHEACRLGHVVPNRPDAEQAKKRMLEPIKGAYVKIPQPGIYENMVVFDFRGLYPSIITSHNIDPFMADCTCCTQEESYVSPTGTRFCRKREGMIPHVLGKIIKARAELKDKLKKIGADVPEYAAMFGRVQSLKILANSYYGYLAFARSRYYSREAAESVTAWGRKFIVEMGELAEKAGFKLLYQDSLPYDRPIFIQRPDGEIELIKIGEFVKKNKDNPQVGKYSTLAFDGKNVVFKPIARAIEHGYDSAKKGKLLEIITTHGKTIVTPQHSVYCHDSKTKEVRLADAKTLKKGDCLVSMTNPPLPEIHSEGERIDAFNLDFEWYGKEMRAYFDKEKFPTSRKGECPYCGIRFASLHSHVSAKHGERKMELEAGKKAGCAWLGGKNAGIGRVPRFWTLDRELAWIMGYYCAEGSASEKSAVHKKLMVSFGSQDKIQIIRLKKYFDRVLEENLAIIENFDKRINKKMYYYRIQRMPLVALFKHGFGMGNKSDGKRVPQIIFSSNSEIKKAFVEGYMEGDGLKKLQRRYRTLFPSFTTKSPELAMGLQLLMKHLPQVTNAWGRKAAHMNWHYRTDKPGITDLRMSGAKRASDEFENFALARIKEIREVEEKGAVFDLEVEGAHNFMDAEGLILVHNTDSLFLLLGDKKKEDALAFMKDVNVNLPGDMELELEAFYPRGVFVSKKAQGSADAAGAKKKYALLGEDGRVKIRGFELVRRDWSIIARETQKKVLEAILKDGSKEKAIRIVKEVVDELRGGKVPMEKLVIETQLKKDPTKYEIVSPESAAALKANKRGGVQGQKLGRGAVVSFIITRRGSSVSEKAELVDFAKDYDPAYYIDHQVLPSVLRILNELGVTEDDLKLKGKQSGLSGFF